ncbi:hypothetical protein [uncultured Gimesia sp.]|uniref:DUF7873 family protein n=1 Tax=uncultured Gimesia sp. TaxID=1678688 RepID=UPI0030D8A190|tara:strand:+ start:6386 stop:7135 length:750 start_codon:yes stop_codon:yes gene_type:complete
MSKLNQIIAVANGKKTKTTREITESYKKVQKSALFEGITRTYQPIDDDGETFPPEKKNIQYSVPKAIEEVSKSLAGLFDTVATQDWANTQAKADIVVDDQTILTDVPVTYMLFLEKQLQDIQTFVSSLPVLDPAENWQWSDAANCYGSEVTQTNKTKKVLRNHVKAEATEHHPAQVETYSEDVVVGKWNTIKFSGAVPATEKNATLQRVGRLIDAVKFARETANMTEVTSVDVSRPIFDYLFHTTVSAE